MALPGPADGAGRQPLFSISDLQVRFATAEGEVRAVCGASIEVGQGEVVAIVGESGSGKSQMVMASLGLLAANGAASGSVRFEGEEILSRPAPILDRIRGDRVSMIFQEPMTSLDPLYSIGHQIAEPIVRHARRPWRLARQRVVELLGLVGIDNPQARLGAYPHELSGGQRQRAMIAMAISNNPALLIADEPTTALDVTVQAQILDLLAALRQRLGMAVLFITHDLGLVRRFAERVYVMRAGEVVEAGPTQRIFAAPRHDYTRLLLAATPGASKPPPRGQPPVLLEARGLAVTYRLGGGLFSRRPALEIKAVDGVDVAVRQGQTLGIVGELGSGKSTLGRALLRLVPAEGSLRFAGRDLLALDEASMRSLRRDLQIVFQDPFGSLSPRMKVGDIVTEGLLVHERAMTSAERDRRAAEALAEVQLDPETRHRYPHEFSGGQRQRIAIARAIILKPRIIVLDEPTSSLDRTVQRQIVDLLRALQAEHDLTYVFISHDLAVVRAMADRIMVMKLGRIVEEGDAEAIFTRPAEAYTRELIAAAFSDRHFGEVA